MEYGYECYNERNPLEGDDCHGAFYLFWAYVFVNWLLNVLLLMLTDHNRHVPITGPKSLGEKSVEYWVVNCKAIEGDGHTSRFSCPPTLFVLSPRAPNSHDAVRARLSRL